MNVRHPTITFKIHFNFVLFSIPRAKEDEMGRACSTNGGEEECI
jgi:hypothetical protein